MTQAPHRRVIAMATTSPQLSIAAAEGHAPVASYTSDIQWRHAESLFEGLEAVLRQARWTLQQVTGVVVATGPGSFTGIRIGLAAARAMAQALEIPVIGINSLEAIAWDMLNRSTHPPSIAVPILNAQRGQVFAAAYTLRGHRLTPRISPRLEPLAVFEQRLKRLAGDDRVLRARDAHPRAESLLELAQPRWKAARPGNYERVHPFYMREAAAVERQK